MSETGRLIEETGLVPKKSRGQNFLTDGATADRQIAYAGISESDRILEVGPGFGALTERLVRESDHVTCIELDEKLADYVSNKFGNDITMVRGDALKIEWPEFDVFVSNLPYSVSTPIIFKLLEKNFRHAVIMVQKEFAERMTAKPGTDQYSRLTVGVYYRSVCKMLETVPASRFNPRPKVDSAVVSLTPRPAPFRVDDEKLYFRITETCFTHRRKKIGTALKNAHIIEKDADLPHLDDRIEVLSPEEIAELSNLIDALRSSP
ncbi:MAG: rRNA (adenine1518-N6/adenine1519-N6)-dimethyltransferase [Candidatus Methanomethylophilaceae archaeon]|nr:rRNA (adenine1518-N6/adenine1519-N6)-dimethyltransferase [Candidatus Methanomethylophilaceae archaeon]